MGWNGVTWDEVGGLVDGEWVVGWVVGLEGGEQH